MGVKGLTSFLREYRHKLSYTLELTSDGAPSDAAAAEETSRTRRDSSSDVCVIVDGWSLLYLLYNTAGEPWVYGGEYAALARHVENVVQAWIRVGIKPTFVFDGPSPLLKYPTVISRLQNNTVNHAILFFRTSNAARSTPRSLAETRIAPPLGYTVMVSALLSMPDVDVRFAEGEADACIVALAGTLGAYVMGNDSDFMVLQCGDSKGYIPLDEMVWCASAKGAGVQSPDSLSVTADDDDDDSEFQVVMQKKKKGKLKVKDSGFELGSGPLPPSTPAQSDLSLVVTVYEPETLASHLSLSTPLLPLLAALVGNDYASFDFFRSNVTSINRVQRVADVLSSVIKDAQSGNVKKLRKIDRGGEGSVMDVIGTTVERLFLLHNSRYPPSDDQINAITEKVIQSTLEYARGLSEHNYSSQDTGSQAQDSGNTVEQVHRLYLQAYRRGVLHPKLLETLTRGTCFPALFLEDPDRECCARSIGRPVREIIWKIFASAGEIPDRPDPDREHEDEDSVENEDELVDVVEEQSEGSSSVVDVVEDEDDPLAALRGKLQRLSFSGLGSEIPEAVDVSQSNTASQSPILSELPLPPLQPKVVTEYVRRGTRVTSEECVVEGLDDLLWDFAENPTPVQLRPLPDRLNVFLKVLGSDTPRIRDIAVDHQTDNGKSSGGKLLLVVALRWILQTLHARTEGLADGSHKREREKEKWTRSEVKAFLSCLSEDEETEGDLPSVEDRPVQLSAQVLSALEAIQWLAEALLLVDLPNSGQSNDHLPIVLGEAEKSFSGRKFHATQIHHKKGSNKLFQQLWDASTEGLEHMFGDEKGKRGKKRKERKDGNQRADNAAKRAAGGMFKALAELDAR